MIEFLKCAKNVQNKPTNGDISRHNATNVLHNVQKMELVSMKISVVLDYRRAKTSGLYPVRIRFNFNKQAIYINTGIDVPEKNFVLNKVVGLPRATMMNNVLGQKLMYVQAVLDELQLNGLLKTKFKTGADIRRYIENRNLIEEPTTPTSSPLLFETLVNEYADKCKSKASKDQYLFMLKKVRSFADIGNLLITDITVAWLKDFEAYCEKTGMNINGRAYYLRPIRVLFNDAIDRELIGADVYPFRRFKIKKGDTEHRNLPMDDLIKLIEHDCGSADMLAMYRDLFLLSFYLCGINLNDLLFLKHTDVRGGYIHTNRNKTNVPMLLKIEPEAMDIINRYRGAKLLLRCMETYNNYDDFRRRMNKRIKTILPYVTVYWARHTWATVAAELDVPDAVIDMALGHKLSGMSAVYIKRNNNKVVEANRKVIDFVHKKIV